MWSSLLLIALCATPSALQQQTKTAEQRVEDLAELLGLVHREISANLDKIVAEAVEFRTEISKLQNDTSRLLTELDTVRGRQAAGAAVQASQVLMLVVYFTCILAVYVVKRCQKVSEKSKRKEFERLEMQLRSSKAKRRAAAAKEKSAPAQSLE
jgi:hypothetical protein